jgi:hypothetical protein
VDVRLRYGGHAQDAVIGGASWSVAALFAGDVAAVVFLMATIATADAAANSRLARAADASRAAAEAVLLGAGAGSLLAVVFTLGQSGDAGQFGGRPARPAVVISASNRWTPHRV